MLDITEKKKTKKLKELNKSFESLLPPLEKRTELDYKYDNCRQSCIMAIEALETKKEEIYSMFIEDARNKFKEISKNYELK